MNIQTHMTAEDQPEATNASTEERSKHYLSKILTAGVGVFALGVVATGIYWSLQPDSFDVREAAISQLGAHCAG